MSSVLRRTLARGNDQLAGVSGQLHRKFDTSRFSIATTYSDDAEML